MKLLLDAGIFMHAEIAAPAVQVKTLKWGAREISAQIAGAARKPLDPCPARQAEFDALFTVGRLIREGRVQAFRYHEVMVELWRGANVPWVNALKDCEIQHCEPAVNRSKFRGTVDSREAHAKGGKKDAGTKYEGSDQTQLAFLCWLKALKPEAIEPLIAHSGVIGLSPFEAESLRQLHWFQVMCERSRSTENYVDVFHLWTAERNGFGLLTLDNKLKRLVERVRMEKSCPVTSLPNVFHPTDLLRELGIGSPDSVPLQPGVFYQSDLIG